jgi:hypothetical protein
MTGERIPVETIPTDDPLLADDVRVANGIYALFFAQLTAAGTPVSEAEAAQIAGDLLTDGGIDYNVAISLLARDALVRAARAGRRGLVRG